MCIIDLKAKILSSVNVSCVWCPPPPQWSGDSHDSQPDFHRPAALPGRDHGLGHDRLGYSGYRIWQVLHYHAVLIETMRPKNIYVMLMLVQQKMCLFILIAISSNFCEALWKWNLLYYCQYIIVLFYHCGFVCVCLCVRDFPLLHGVCQSEGRGWIWCHHPWPGPPDRLLSLSADPTDLAGLQ